MWGCFAFLMGLKHVNATPSSRKTPFVDNNRRYVRSVGRLTSFWKIWPGKMLAEARANGFLRTRGLTYRRLLSTALCFSRRRVVERQGGGKTAFRMLASQPVSRGRVTTSAIPLMCRGMTNHRHAVSAMPLTHHKPKCHVPCFLRRKSVGKRRARGVTLPLHGVLLQVVGLILLKIPIEQSHGVSHAWLLANMLGVKKSHVAHRFRGR